MSELITAIQQMAGTHDKSDANIVVCTVDSVNEAERTCNVTSVNTKSELSFTDVELMAGVNDGFLLVPTVGSQVIVSYSTITDPYVSMFSELDKVVVIVGDYSIELTADGMSLNGDEFGGLIKIQELVDKINRLENKVNDLITKYNSHTHILTLSAGTGTAAPTVTTETSITPVTTVNDLENDTIQHGSGI